MGMKPNSPNQPNTKSDEQEVFEEFNITDEDEQARVRGLAAARVLANRKIAKMKPPKKGWGEE